ncbi:putative RING-H2 finger protein ATL12 [Wolffia australiana]
MGSLRFLAVVVGVVGLSQGAAAQGGGGYSMPMGRSGAAIIIGIFSLVFAFTALLFVCAKYCQARRAHGLDHWPDPRLGPPPPVFLDDEPRLSGVDKALIELLPLFKFCQLEGAPAGLECAICMARFDDDETLRLLPKCRHAFHRTCVDHWLAAHATCPLCRGRVTADDLAAFRARPGPLGLERDPSHRFKHRVVLGNRWSDLNPADLVSLETEFSGPSRTRAMSDIGRLSRAPDAADDDAAAARWRPVVAKTVRWFAAKEKAPQPLNR